MPETSEHKIAPPGTVPSAPGFWSRLAQLALRVLLAGLPVYLLSLLMTTYSGTSLLFPKSWRDIVIGVASLMGILLYEYGHGHHDKYSKTNAQGEEHTTRQGWRVIWTCFAGMLLSVCCFFLLRGRCVHHFDPTTWLMTQVKADYYRVGTLPNDLRDKIAKEVLVDSAPGHESGRKELDSQDDSVRNYVDSLTPEFDNREQKLICLPFWLPAEDQKQVDHVAHIRNDDGIRVILDEQPGLIINWLNSDARTAVHYTTLAFLADYLLVIGFAAYLLGLRFDPVKSIWEGYFKIV